MAAAAPATALAAPPEEAVPPEAYKAAIQEIYREQPQALRGNSGACVIIVGSGGYLGASPEAMVLTSTAFGGSSGRAEVVATNGSFSLVLDTPAGFSMAPNGGNEDMVFSTLYSGFGSTSFSQVRGGIPTRLKRGQTSVQVDLTATKITGLFPAGHYRADVTMRCE